MAKITAIDLMCADGWYKFFKKLGWKYQYVDTVSGVGFYSTGVTKPTKADPNADVLVIKSITGDERMSIERTWSDQGKPEIKAVSNG